MNKISFLIIFVFCQICAVPRVAVGKNNVLASSTRDERQAENILTFGNDTILINFTDTGVLVSHVKAYDTITITIKFKVDEDKKNICQNCLLVRSKGADTLLAGTYLTPNMFLLPILDFSDRLIMFGLNFNAKKQRVSDGLTEVYALPTVAEQYVVLLDKLIIITIQKLIPNQNGYYDNVVVDVWKVRGSKIKKNKSERIVLSSDIQAKTDVDAKSYAISKILERYR